MLHFTIASWSMICCTENGAASVFCHLKPDSMQTTNCEISLVTSFFRHALISRCDALVVAPLAEYGEICGRANALLHNKNKAKEAQQSTMNKLQQSQRSGTQAQGKACDIGEDQGLSLPLPCRSTSLPKPFRKLCGINVKNKD